jgi:hypothetical protein
MNKAFYPIVLFITICVAISACSNGDYNANPSSNANGTINPLNPLNASQFTWTGTGKVSANINGSPWVADSAQYYLIDSTGTNAIVAVKGKQVLYMYFKSTWTGNVYNMGFKQYNELGEWLDNTDSVYDALYYYQSALGNSGEMYMVLNDTANFNGKFYFQAVNGKGGITNFTNGAFSLKKY